MKKVRCKRQGNERRKKETSQHHPPHLPPCTIVISDEVHFESGIHKSYNVVSTVLFSADVDLALRSRLVTFQHPCTFH